MRAPTGGRGAWAVVGRSGAAVGGGGSAAAGGRSPKNEANSRDIFDGGWGRGDRLGWGHIKILYKASKGFTKTQTIYKAPKHYTKTQHIRHILETFNKNRNTH